jgi:hypothetical protein
MATTSTGSAAARKGPAAVRTKETPNPPGNHAPGDYVLPFVHARIPAPLVQIGFWGGLAGTVAFGVIDLPLAALVGVGVVVARHRRSR